MTRTSLSLLLLVTLTACASDFPAPPPGAAGSAGTGAAGSSGASAGVSGGGAGGAAGQPQAGMNPGGAGGSEAGASGESGSGGDSGAGGSEEAGSGGDSGAAGTENPAGSGGDGGTGGDGGSGGSGGGGEAGSSGQGGAGQSGAGGATCTQDEQCVLVGEPACASVSCEGGACISAFKPENTEVTTGPGFCQKTVCNGEGGLSVVVAASHKPADTACAIYACNGDKLSPTFQPAGTDCGGGNVCNANGQCEGECKPGEKECVGNVLRTCQPSATWDAGEACQGSTLFCDASAGKCVECKEASQCSQPSDKDCSTAVCEAGVCGITKQPDNKDISNDSATDCTKTVCLDGKKSPVANNTEAPTDNDVCTVDTCEAGAPKFSPKCGGATSCCGGSCFDLQNDPNNCGACGTVCASGYCGGGVCGKNSCIDLAKTCGNNKSESCCATDPVPGGTFLMGRGSGTDSYSSGDPNEIPEHQVQVAPFELDRYEVTVGRFRKFVAGYDAFRPTLKAGMGAHPLIPGSGWNATWDSELKANGATLSGALKCDASYQTWTDSDLGNDNKPQNCVTWYEAFAFCIWDGGRLATEAEWEFAAVGGSENRLYPWGPQQPNTALASYGCTYTGDSQCKNEDLLVVGSKPAGMGRWNHKDLAGSLFEWTFDGFDSGWYSQHSSPGSCKDCANTIGSQRIVRGGSFYNLDLLLRGANRGYYAQTDRPFNTGIRCARTL